MRPTAVAGALGPRRTAHGPVRSLQGQLGPTSPPSPPLNPFINAGRISLEHRHADHWFRRRTANPNTFHFTASANTIATGPSTWFSCGIALDSSLSSRQRPLKRQIPSSMALARSRFAMGFQRILGFAMESTVSTGAASGSRLSRAPWTGVDAAADAPCFGNEDHTNMSRSTSCGVTTGP